ncbi:MAG TPA: sigma-70 family RNA polymerase sigma factor [Bryobacteraceae bacterium]|nr:sigma-70 family RNA polymerase sigma factor [Bryobacteraceae bacterium]
MPADKRFLPLSEAEEAALVERAQARDEEAFQELMRRNSSSSLRLALSILKNQEEAEDQVQTSFMNAWRRLESFQRDSKFSTWLRKIVVNQSLMRLRSQRRAAVQSLDQEADGTPLLEPPDLRPDQETALGNRELTVHLRREIGRLPPLFREVLELRDLRELELQEVARQLGISEAATKSRLARARQMLRQRMERHVRLFEALA